jgi:hypothetical protein
MDCPTFDKNAELPELVVVAVPDPLTPLVFPFPGAEEED